VKTKMIEAVQSAGRPGNWGKFLVGVFDERERAHESRVDPGRELLAACGWWGTATSNLWVLDLQTGEGAFLNPHGSANADLARHRVWVCPMYEPFLEWLYAAFRADPGLDIAGLPDVVELPDAEFALAGYRRPGPASPRS
jgi:hypothetical protein